MYIKSLKKLSAIVFTVVVFCCIFILCSCGNKTDSPTEVTTNNTIEPTTVSEATDSNDATENNNDAAFKAGKYLVNIDKKIICAKDDGLYYKESLESEGKKLSNEKNVYTIMSDGETVFYGEGYDIADSNQRNTPKKVYKTTISKNTSELLFESDGYIELIGIRNNCIYYLDKNESNQAAVMKFNISDNSKSKLTKDWNGQINFSCVLGNKLYAYFKNNDNSKGTFRAYDLSTEEFEDIYSGMMTYSIFHDENRVVFDTFSISENSGNKKDNHVTYTVEKDGTVKKSPVITEDCSFEYATSDGKYGLYFSTPSSGKFDLYTIDLESGEVFTSENDAASCIGKNYFVTSDLLHPEKIYFMYNLKLYDINTKSAKKISHEDFEIDITKPMWIIDGNIVDGDLNTYKIYDESSDSSDATTVDALVEDARSLKMQNIEYAIPKILIDSPNAKQVNEEILKKYTPYFEDINAYNMQGSTTEISYTAEISQGILSICIKRHTGMEIDYDVYNFDISAGTLITNEELCQKIGENYSNIQEQIVQGIRDYYGKFGSGTNKEWIESRMNESLGEENLAETKMFLEKGKIKVFYKVKALAGASYYYNELEI